MRLNSRQNQRIFCKGTISLFLFLLLTLSVFSQKYSLRIDTGGNDLPMKLKRNISRTFRDTIQLFQELYKVKNELIAKGYIAASFDSIEIDSVFVSAYLHIGERYTINEFIVTNSDSIQTDVIELKKKSFKKDVFSPDILLLMYEKTIRELENTGYPFAMIIPEDVEMKDGKINMKLSIHKGKRIQFNNLIIKGSSNLSEKYIRRFLGFYQGDPYSENIIYKSRLKMPEITFVNQIRPPEVDFYEDKADLYVYLNKSKANLFNGIIGFIPKEEDNYTLSLTGDLSVDLINNFNRAERINLHWVATGDQSQKLKAGLKIPYLFGSPFGSSFDFRIDKRDTSFVKTDLKGTLDFSFKNNDKIFAFAAQNNSFIISGTLTDSSLYQNSRSILIGLGYSTENLDYRLNPSNGFLFTADIANGYRETGDESSTFFSVNATIDLYIPIYRKLVFKLSNQNKYLISDFDFYENELYYAGGFNSIRGFDEDIFLTSGITILTSELRILYEQNSNAFLFIDYGRLITQNAGNRSLKFPIGFGAGTSFSTRAGIFSIAYALGKLNDTPVQFANSKIHIGYVNRF